jgi:hypothetical protein
MTGQHTGSNSHFGTITLWERLSSREKSWQDATLTAFWSKADVIMRIAGTQAFWLRASALGDIMFRHLTGSLGSFQGFRVTNGGHIPLRLRAFV